MNSSISRLMTALPMALIMSVGLVLLTWSLNEISGPSTLFNLGITYTIVLFTFMCFITIRKIVISDSNDHSKAKLEALLAAATITSKNHTQIQNEVENVDFDYTQIPPQTIPKPEYDKSLQF